MLNLNHLNTTFGEVYQEGDGSLDRLLKRIRRPNGMLQFFTSIPTDSDVSKVSLADVASGLQAYQSTYTPTQVADIFKGRIIDVGLLKIDKELEPEKIVKTWMGFLSEVGKPPEEYPFVKWLVEATLDAYEADLELKCLYNGVYVAPTTGVAGQPQNAMNGLGVQIASAITAGEVTPISTPVITGKNNIIDVVDSFVDGLDETVNNMSPYIFMSKQNARYMQRALDIRHASAQTTDGPLDPMMVNYGDKTIVGLSGMGTSQRIWTAPKANRWHLYQSQQLPPWLEGRLRQVSMLMTTRKAVAIADWRMFGCNDKA